MSRRLQERGEFESYFVGDGLGRHGQVISGSKPSLVLEFPRPVLRKNWILHKMKDF